VSGRLTTRTGWRWSHRTLGRSLPIYRPLLAWRYGLSAAAALLLAFCVWRAWAAQHPPIERPLSASQSEELVVERLRAVELPAWDPGENLPPTELPPFDEPAPPPPWDEPLSSRPLPGEALRGSAAELARQARRALADPAPQSQLTAATLYARAADRAPAAWSPRFHAGLALLALGDHTNAAASLLAAVDRLQALPGDGGPRRIAAEIATRYAAGLALLPDDCVDAVRQLKLAVGALDGFVDAEGALVYDRNLPFEVTPSGLDNHAVWIALAHAYTRCEGRYPRQYVERYGRQTKGFLQVEYDDPNLAAVRNGPFPGELASCIEAARAEGNGEPARCWALSNLNRVYYANRSFLPAVADGSGQAGGGGTANADLAYPAALARLAYNVAWLAAQGEADRAGAHRYLEQARLLNRQVADDARRGELARRIAALGRHLAPLTRNYSALAEKYAGRSAESLRLDERTPAEDVKGVAWHLTRRWQRMLAAGRPADVLAEAETQRRWAGPYGAELAQWRRRVQRSFGDALVQALENARDNGNLPVAAALRDYRAGWLGAAWPERAADAWFRAGPWVLWLSVWVLGALVGWAVYRLAVYPYLTYVTDFYRSEFQRRETGRGAEDPFTRRQWEEYLAHKSAVR